jgi:putative ABC transport system permease protein
MILAATGVAGIVATVLMRARVFTSAAQLAVRPGNAETSNFQRSALIS